MLSPDEKNSVILACADALVSHSDEILSANRSDIDAAKGVMSDSMIDRLTLTAERIEGMANGMKKVAQLPDPVGRIISRTEHENGLLIEKITVPLGVVAMIYESRPNVTSDAATLCFKSGNACVLRGGKECYRSSLAIVNILRKTLKEHGINEPRKSFYDGLNENGVNAGKYYSMPPTLETEAYVEYRADSGRPGSGAAGPAGKTRRTVT